MKGSLSAAEVHKQYSEGVTAFRRQIADATLRVKFTQEADVFLRACALGVWQRDGASLTPRHVEYYNAIYTVENALAKVKDEKGMKKVERFLTQETCPECHGTRLSEKARAPKVRGISLADATHMTLKDLVLWVKGVPESLPETMRPMAQSICDAFLENAKRLMDLGLS